MGIKLHCHHHVAMAKVPLSGLNIHTGIIEERGIGMPEIVAGDIKADPVRFFLSADFKQSPIGFLQLAFFAELLYLKGEPRCPN